ncbi:MAG: ABC-2 type transport system ATP-binding protein [Gammaproteobacteria bacterium]|jgi:ABC-2 type transport system ATP-binding protein
MIEISHLTKQFGPLKAVDDVSLSIAAGEVLGFLGPNGAGKSTTMKMITGFLTPDSGSVSVGGDDVAIHPMAVKRRIGYLPEGAPLYGDMTPRSFLNFIAEIRGYKAAEKQRRVDEAVARTSIGDVLEKPIETLSKGFKRRVGLAQAILHDPQVLILDEPTDGLDPNQKHEVRELIRAMAPDKVIVLSTHILEEVEAVCSRAVIIAGGRLVFDGTPQALMARSAMHNAVTISIETTDIEQARGAITQLPGVASVNILEHNENRGTLQVLASDGAALAAPVSALSRDNGWQVHGLSVERGRLDDVFRDITRAGGPERG